MANKGAQHPKPLRETVYDEIKLKILQGKIPPKTRLMEVPLAEQMGVSRTPVREAIRKLEEEQLVTIEPQHGAYASDISKQDILDVLEVRLDVESLAARLAAERITKEKLDRLTKLADIYQDYIDEGDMDAMIEYDTRFHSLIAEATGNKLLIKITENIQEKVIRFRYVYYDDFRRAQKQPHEHREIISALATGDPEKAAECMATHIRLLQTEVKKEDFKCKTHLK